MHFNADFFDGKNSANKGCVLLYNDSHFIVEYNGETINLEKINWQKTATKLLLTSESIGKQAYIAIDDANDRHEILKFLVNVKKTSSSWFSRSCIIYYSIICGMVALWCFLDSLVFLLPNSIEPWLEKQARLVHFRNPEVLANDSNNETLGKIKEAFIGIDQSLQGIEIEIVHSEELNAVTLPNKKVIIYSELINKADSIEEVMGVLAHEMTHVKYRHCVAAYLKVSFLSCVDKIISGGALSESGALIYLLQFSKKNEMQADDGAIKYLDQLRLSTKGMMQFFTKVKEKDFSKFWLFELFNTHPSPHDRVNLFSSYNKTYKKSNFSEKDLTKLKSVCAIKKDELQL
jgi:Zn-dependent protease with chaperone function